MQSSSDNVLQTVLLSHTSVRLSGQILLPRYRMNGWNNYDKTDSRQYSLAPMDDLIKFWRSRSQQAVEV